jgi:hypothetical protein
VLLLLMRRFLRVCDSQGLDRLLKNVVAVEFFCEMLYSSFRWRTLSDFGRCFNRGSGAAAEPRNYCGAKRG